MPRVRIKVPVDVELSDEQLEVAESAATLAKKAHDAGIFTAIRDVGASIGRLFEARRRSRRS